MRQADWLLPVAKLAAVFRRRMEAAWQAEVPAEHAAVAAGTWRRRWVVHTQPAGSGEAVVRYLARYVSRTAIGDERIVSADDETVTLAVKLYVPAVWRNDSSEMVVIPLGAKVPSEHASTPPSLMLHKPCDCSTVETE